MKKAVEHAGQRLFEYLVVECGRGFNSDLQSLEASLRYLSLLLEIVCFTLWQPSDRR